MTREPGRAPPRHAHGDLTSLAPHGRLPEILVVPREKTPTGAGARGTTETPPLERHPQLSLATRGEDWASQGQPKGKAEIPVVTRERRRNSRKTISPNSTSSSERPGPRRASGSQAQSAGRHAEQGIGLQWSLGGLGLTTTLSRGEKDRSRTWVSPEGNLMVGFSRTKGPSGFSTEYSS